MARLGWALFWIGIGWEALYHLLPWLFRVQWTPTADLIASLGHVVILGGITFVIGALIAKRNR